MTKDKDCCEKKDPNPLRRCLGFLLFLIILILLIIFIVWLVLRPTKPRFYLQDVSVQQFNLSSSPNNLLTSTIQTTITSTNPNDRIGIYYDRLLVFASYKYQQITAPSQLLPLYQGHHDVAVWSPVLTGDQVPVAPYLCDELKRDESSGYFWLYVKIDGRVRWRVGSWISGHYHLFVTCQSFLTLVNGAGESPVVRFGGSSSCSVDV